jgi:peptide/nickel transport system permease protein
MYGQPAAVQTSNPGTRFRRGLGLTRGLYTVLRANPLTFVGFLMVAFVMILAFLIVTVPFVTGLFGTPISILPHDPSELLPCANPTECATPPSLQNPLGTDNLGRDMLSRVLAALPLDLVIGFSVAGFALLVGTGLGLVAGFWDRPGTIGGVLSLAIMRTTDIFLAFPSLVLALAIAASLGRGTGPSLIAVMATWWPFYVRLVRGEVLAVKHLPYISAAQAAGISGFQILFRHVLRNILEPLVVFYTMDVGTVIVTYSTISFIGIGVPPTTPEWGSMVESYQRLLLTAPWTVLAPGAAIFLTVLAFSLLGDGLRDILDPRSRRALVQTTTAPGLPAAKMARAEA